MQIDTEGALPCNDGVHRIIKAGPEDGQIELLPAVPDERQPSSPVLAHSTYRSMWDETDWIARVADCNLRACLDDITVSGPVVRSETVHAIKRILRKRGHRTRDGWEESG